MTWVPNMASEATFLLAQFLEWIDRQPRSYRDVRTAWSSTCPLNSTWEDAVSDDLIAYGSDGIVTLTPRGRARLEERARLELKP